MRRSGRWFIYIALPVIITIVILYQVDSIFYDLNKYIFSSFRVKIFNYKIKKALNKIKSFRKMLRKILWNKLVNYIINSKIVDQFKTKFISDSLSVLILISLSTIYPKRAHWGAFLFRRRYVLPRTCHHLGRSRHLLGWSYHVRYYQVYAKLIIKGRLNHH